MKTKVLRIKTAVSWKVTVLFSKTHGLGHAADPRDPVSSTAAREPSTTRAGGQDDAPVVTLGNVPRLGVCFCWFCFNKPHLVLPIGEALVSEPWKTWVGFWKGWEGLLLRTIIKRIRNIFAICMQYFCQIYGQAMFKSSGEFFCFNANL